MDVKKPETHHSAKTKILPFKRQSFFEKTVKKSVEEIADLRLKAHSLLHDNDTKSIKKRMQVASELPYFSAERNEKFISIIKEIMSALDAICAIYQEAHAIETVSNLKQLQSISLAKEDSSMIESAYHLLKEASVKVNEEYKESAAFYPLEQTLMVLETMEKKRDHKPF